MLLSPSGIRCFGGGQAPAVACKRRLSNFIVPCVQPFVFKGRKPVLLSPSGSGASVKLDLAGGVLEPAVACERFHCSMCGTFCFCSCKTEIGRKPMLLSPSGSGALEAKLKLELAGGLLEPAVACKRRMSDTKGSMCGTFFFGACKTEIGQKPALLTLPRSGDLLFLCWQNRTLGIRCSAEDQAGDCGCFCI